MHINVLLVFLVPYIYEQCFHDFFVQHGKDPIFSDSENFKIHKACKVLKSDATNMQHNCMITPGNSGGGLISAKHETLIGLVNSNKDLLREFNGVALGVPSPAFYGIYQRLIKNENIN